MDIDFNVDIVKRKIEELESVNRFPSSDEKTKKNFFENWIKARILYTFIMDLCLHIITDTF